MLLSQRTHPWQAEQTTSFTQWSHNSADCSPLKVSEECLGARAQCVLNQRSASLDAIVESTSSEPLSKGQEHLLAFHGM